jgi:hypothetical protein
MTATFYVINTTELPVMTDVTNILPDVGVIDKVTPMWNERWSEPCL